MANSYNSKQIQFGGLVEFLKDICKIETIKH